MNAPAHTIGRAHRSIKSTIGGMGVAVPLRHSRRARDRHLIFNAPLHHQEIGTTRRGRYCVTGSKAGRDQRALLPRRRCLATALHGPIARSAA